MGEIVRVREGSGYICSIYSPSVFACATCCLHASLALCFAPVEVEVVEKSVA